VARKSDLTLTVSREIRDGVRELGTRIDTTNERLDAAILTLDHMELGLLELAEQQRFVVRYLRAGAERDHRFEVDLAALRARVEALEARGGG